MNSLNVDVDLDDRQPERPLDRIPNRIPEVVGNFGNPRPKFDDDKEGYGDPILADLDLNAAVQIFSVQPLRQTVAKTLGRHRDHPIAPGGGMAGNQSHDMA